MYPPPPRKTRQRLIYRGKVLADDELLSTYKVENGHFVHMVARPRGVPSPASTSAGPSYDHGTRRATVDGADPTAGAPDGARAGTLGQRLLMGMGLPVFASGEGGGGGGGAVHAAQQAGRATGGAAGAFGATGGFEADNTLLNAAATGLDGGQFLSNMLGLAGGGGGGGGGGRGGLAGVNVPTAPLDAMLNSLGGRAAARGPRREGVAVSGVGTRGDPAAGGAGAGVGGDAGGPGRDLEHVRQGLLTLHTLLSGTASGRRRRRGQRREAGSRSAGGADSGSAYMWPAVSGRGKD